MSRASRAALAVAIFSLLAGTVASAAGGASAGITPDFITVDDASSPDANLGLLSVDVTSTTPITSLVIHINSSGTDVLDPAATEATATSGSPYETEYTVTTPITTAQLPIGDYDVTVDATDTGGTVATGGDAGTWEFTPSAVLTLKASRTAIDFGHPTATVTGTVMLRAPDGTVTPFQNGTVEFGNGWDGGPQSAPTDASGAFSATVAPVNSFGSSEAFWAALPDASSHRGNASPAVIFNISVDPTAITATQSPKPVKYGVAPRIIGKITYQPGGKGAYQVLTTPVPIRVYLFGTSKPIATGETGTNGTYSIKVPATIGGQQWGVSAIPSTFLLNTAGADLVSNVMYPTTITGFRASVNRSRKVSTSACLGFTSAMPPGVFINYEDSIRVQYATSKTGPWHSLSTSDTDIASCGHSGRRIAGTAVTTLTHAYYRVYFPGHAPSSLANFGGYYASASTPVYLTVP
jgi:hypothetical protein